MHWLTADRKIKQRGASRREAPFFVPGQQKGGLHTADILPILRKMLKQTYASAA